MKIVTIVQARTASTRLPNKVLLSAVDKPLLLHMIERLERAKYSGTIVIATTTNPEDNVIEKFCRENNLNCFRGHATDLLDRHYKTAVEYDADIVLKIPSDCPLIDPEIVDLVVIKYVDNLSSYDFVSNLRPPTFPDGNDVEVMSFETLKYVWQVAKLAHEREHTTPFIWNNTDLFRIGNVEWGGNLDFSSTHRWTLDYEEDYTFIRSIFENLYKKNPKFGLYDILNLLDEKPFLKEINRKHNGKYWYNNEEFNNGIGYNYL